MTAILAIDVTPLESARREILVHPSSLLEVSLFFWGGCSGKLRWRFVVKETGGALLLVSQRLSDFENVQSEFIVHLLLVLNCAAAMQNSRVILAAKKSSNSCGPHVGLFS
jgi:hypothetical protein